MTNHLIVLQALEMKLSRGPERIGVITSMMQNLGHRKSFTDIAESERLLRTMGYETGEGWVWLPSKK